MKGEDWNDPLLMMIRTTIIDIRIAAYLLNTGRPFAGVVNQERGLGNRVTIIPARAIRAIDRPNSEKRRWPG